MDAKTRGEWLREAVAHQRAGRWSMADAARAAALTSSANDTPATRPEPGELRPGTILRHMRWGKVEAECLYAGEGDYRVEAVSYRSLLDATRAAATALGKKTTARPNALRFWGLEKQVQEDPRGFEQTRTDVDLDDDAEIEANEPEFTTVFASASDEGEE